MNDQPREPKTPGPPITRRRLALLLILAALASLARHAPLMTSPFDDGHEATNGARYAGAITRVWLEDGFLAHAGRPILSSLPTIPASGSTYANHPPLVYWLYFVPVRLFGLAEWSLRLVPVLMTAIFVALMVLVAARTLGVLGGIVALLLALASPMMTHFGRMAGFEIPLLPLGTAMMLLAAAPARRAEPLLFAAAFVAAWVDWPAAFFLPGVFLAAGERRRRRTLIAGAAVGLGFLGYVLLLRHWEGPLATRILKTAFGMSQGEGGFFGPGFFANQATYAARLWGALPVLVWLGSLPAMAARLRRGAASPLDRVVLGATIAGLVEILVFRGRALNHDYWSYFLAPAIFGSGALLVVRLRRRSRAAAAVALLLLLVEAPFGLSRQLELGRPGTSRAFAARIDAVVDRDTLVAMDRYRGNWIFYTDAWVCDGMAGELDGQRIIGDFQAGRYRSSKLILVLDHDVDRRAPELAGALEAAGGRRIDAVQDMLFIFERR